MATERQEEIIAKAIIMPPEQIVTNLVRMHTSTKAAANNAATEYLADAMNLTAACYKSVLELVVGHGPTKELLSISSCAICGSYQSVKVDDKCTVCGHLVGE
jgi:hypothetical protein